MKLKSFNPEVLPVTTGPKQKPALSIHISSGLFTINGSACELIGLVKEDQVEVYQDEQDSENWYIAKVKEGGFQLRSNSEGTRSLFFSSKQLCTLILASVDAHPSKPGVRLPIAGQPTKLGKQTLFGILAIAAKR